MLRVMLVDEEGREVEWHNPGPLGEPFGDAVGLFLAGSFAARTDLLRKAGGYLEGLADSEQFELFIRLLAVARAAGLTMVGEDVRMLRTEQRHTTHRPMRNPRCLYGGTRWIVARHPETFAGACNAVARFEGIVGTTGARLGEWQAARRHFLRSALAVPASWKRWGRLALATVPAIGRRVWGSHHAWASHEFNEIGILRQTTSDQRAGERELFLAWRYRENSPNFQVNPQTQTSVHELGSRLARKRRWTRILDLRRIDGDLEGEATWDGLKDYEPDLIICANLVERVADPVALLHHLTRISAGRAVLLSTADGERRDPDRPLGPPSNPDHRREWTRDQFELLLLSTGFGIERVLFLPRRWTSLVRPLQRMLRHRCEPDPDATMVFLVWARLP